MTWILAQQRENDRIVFFTDESEEKNVLRYKKFLDYIKQYSVQNPIEFQNELDKFHIIHINVITGEWKQIQKEYDSNVDFETLNKLNTIEEKVDHHTLMVNRAKEYLNKIYEDRKKQHGNDFFRKSR